ncbi:MAG TPA: hypothetical protein VIV40_10030 [Kofleriaceae bacterium]
MIQRFCFVKLLDDEVASRGELADKLRAELIDAGADVVVGLPADDSAARWDLSIVITAASLEAWSALSQLPAMTGVLDDLAERAAVVKAWTFQAVSPAGGGEALD